jgi:predicted DNA-binding transcriptional regulator AlpA
MTNEAASPYTMDEPPTSTGRALLSRAFSHWCAIHHGYAPEEIAAAFGMDAPAAPEVKQGVHAAARLIGELIACGEMQTYARPIGGGSPVPVTADDWELDDFRQRVSRSAFDPTRPFDPDADPTHWIFVELEDFNRVVEASCADVASRRRRSAATSGPASQPAEINSVALSEDRHVRMPEIMRRTGMSKSTVYRRIAQERFPRQILMDAGNIASWWESEVAEWIANPR